MKLFLALVAAAAAAALVWAAAPRHSQDDLWRAATEAIRTSPRYGGLELGPQEGLVPLGPSPSSGLWEFWHPASGARPQRDPATGELLPTAQSGLVFVLLPGGTFTMGAQSQDPDAPRYDPAAAPDETPHEVTLAPFFLSKYEMTQGQWARLCGARPSLFDARKLGGDRHPVERVTWRDAMRALVRVGLELPTEAQWEYGARGGTDTVYWTGNDPASVGAAQAANVLDADAARDPATRDWDRPEPFEDGYLVHAPVGSFAPNPFGLCDVIGNVWEWCRDVYGSYELPTDPTDGLRLVPGRPPVLDSDWDRVFRGGSYHFGLGYARAALRMHIDPDHHGAPLGVRPARPVR